MLPLKKEIYHTVFPILFFRRGVVGWGVSKLEAGRRWATPDQHGGGAEDVSSVLASFTTLFGGGSGDEGEGRRGKALQVDIGFSCSLVSACVSVACLKCSVVVATHLGVKLIWLTVDGLGPQLL